MDHQHIEVPGKPSLALRRLALKQFLREVIEPMMLPQAQWLLNQHRDQGDYLLIITSTNGFITKPIAKALQVDDILATDAEIVDGRYTGKMTGTPCFQDGKITRLHQWLESADEKGFVGDLTDCYFYSDSINDLPLLKVADNPVAVDPDDTLRAHAQAAGWKIMSLRD